MFVAVVCSVCFCWRAAGNRLAWPTCGSCSLTRVRLVIPFVLKFVFFFSVFLLFCWVLVIIGTFITHLCDIQDKLSYRYAWVLASECIGENSKKIYFIFNKLSNWSMFLTFFFVYGNIETLFFLQILCYGKVVLYTTKICFNFQSII